MNVNIIEPSNWLLHTSYGGRVGIKIVWDDDTKTVIRYVFDTQWSWDDFFTAKAEAYTRIDTVSHKVGIIMDAPPDVTLPPNALTHGRTALKNKHPNTALVVCVLTKPFLRAMINMLIRLARGSSASIHMVSSVEEARQLIAERLALLPSAELSPIDQTE
jgi:hypothetical protein